MKSVSTNELYQVGIKREKYYSYTHQPSDKVSSQPTTTTTTSQQARTPLHSCPSSSASGSPRA